jgi:hypothetical protein
MTATFYSANQFAKKVLGIQREKATPWLRAFERHVAPLEQDDEGQLRIYPDAASLMLEAFQLSKLNQSDPDEAVKIAFHLRKTGVSLNEFVELVRDGKLQASAQSMGDLIDNFQQLRAQFALVKHVDLEFLVTSKMRQQKQLQITWFATAFFLVGLIFGKMIL